MESALLSQLDMIIAIQDSKIQAWHEKNLIINWDHYSIWARGLGLNFVMYLQNYGAGVYFHPYISFRDNNTQYKYGAIALSTLVKDLTEWEHFYIAGRLHKPVLQLQNNSVVAEAQSKNLNSALSVALLLLPHQFSEDDLYKTIAGLSYTGDIRMKFGENPQKIENIVSGNTEHFRQLYSPHLEKFAASDIIKMYKPNSGSFTIEQDFSKHNALMLILPKNLKEQMLKFHTPNQGEDFFSSLISKGKTREVLAQSLSSIVQKSSKMQTLKGIITAGVARSITYGLAKVIKRIAQKPKIKET